MLGEALLHTWSKRAPQHFAMTVVSRPYRTYWIPESDENGYAMIRGKLTARPAVFVGCGLACGGRDNFETSQCYRATSACIGFRDDLCTHLRHSPPSRSKILQVSPLNAAASALRCTQGNMKTGSGKSRLLVAGLQSFCLGLLEAAPSFGAAQLTSARKTSQHNPCQHSTTHQPSCCCTESHPTLQESVIAQAM